MSNVIKYTTTPVNDTIKKGNFALGVNDVDYGPTNITGFYATTIPSTSGYTIYNQSGGTLSYQSVSGTTALINYLSNKRGVNMTTAGEALSWAAGQSSIFVTNREYENIVTSGMVLNLDAGFVSSYPTSANTWYDLSYSGNNGTLVNSPTFSSLSGGSIVFDGVDDYVNCGSGSTLNLTSGITITSIYRLNGLPSASGNPNVVDKWDWPNNLRSFSMGTESGLFGARVSYDGSFNNSLPLLSSNLPQIGGLYFQTLTYNGQVGVMYLNELPVINSFATPQGLFNNQTTEVWVGRSRDTGQGGRWINANIFQTQIYNRALSPFEVYQNYNAMKGRFGIPDIVTSGLTLNMDAGNPYSYNPLNTGSTTWVNTTNITSGGTLTNGTFYSGGTMVFDGVDDYVNGTLSSFNVGSINMWFNPAQLINESSSGTSLLTLRWNGTENSEWYVGLGSITSVLNNEYITILNVTNNSRTGITDGGSLSANTWYNLVINSESNYYEIYLNGQYKTTTRGNGGVTTLTNPNTLGIGALTRNIGVLNFNGKISTTSLYNRGLSPSEIYQNFNSIKNRYGYYDIVQEGLVLNLDAGNPNSYSRLNTGSTTWNDVSGYGNNGTLINGTYYSGGTMVFDGTDDYVESANNLGLSGTNPRTYGVWVKIRTYLDNSGIIRTGAQGTANADMSLETTTTPGTFTFNGWVNDFDFTISSNFYGWHYLVITYTGTQGQAYADGVLKNSLTFTSAAPNSKLQLGSDRQAGAVQGNNLDGSIGEAHVYNRLLTAAEVLQNFNATRYKYGV